MATLAVGLFDRSAAAPVFGFFSTAGAAGMTAGNPLSATAFAALRGALGSRVPVGDADTAEPRRYLFRAIGTPGADPPPVRLRNFPRLAGGAVPRAYNLFAAAFDGADGLVGYHEQDVTEADLVAGAVSFQVDLDRDLGALHATAEVAGSQAHPLEGLDALVIGVFDSGEAPALGFVRDATGNAPLDGSRPWFQAVAVMLGDVGLSGTSDAGRYCIREFLGPVAGGAMAVTFRNLPAGRSYLPFLAAVDGGAGVGCLVAAAQEVRPGATVSVPVGAFTVSEGS